MQDLFMRFFGIYLLLLWSPAAHAQLAGNQAPEVEILKPQAGDQLNWNTLLPYSIRVKDAEDGNSEYEEIAVREVLLIVQYLEDITLEKSYLGRLKKDLAPLLMMSQSTCLNCHAASSKLIGPSFDLIAKKYRAKEDAQAYLAEKILQGSTGTWGEEKMPPQPDISAADVDRIVDWILKQDKEPIQFQVGLTGGIRTRETPGAAQETACVLTAVYQDHGSANDAKDRKIGLQSITLKIK